MSVIVESLQQRFINRFGATPRVFRAPGRVNLIGEHTDYNGGFVLPVALQMATWVAAAPRTDRVVRAVSESMDEPAVIDLVARPSPKQDWTDYVAGVAYVLEDAGYRLTGADLLIASTVPRGAGLSSSAALEVAVAMALLSGKPDLSAVASAKAEGWPPQDSLEIARLCQRAENEYVGARCGIMDQFVATHARAGHALLLDCRSMAHEAVAVPATARLVVAHTGVAHRIAAGEYNARRSQCDAAAAAMALDSLRDATEEHIARASHAMSGILRKRARHVVTENQRVLDVAAALRAGDLDRAGTLMVRSHESLRDDFEVSGRELDLMVEHAMALPGVLGARMTGGGFGGCVVCLTRAGAAAAAAAALRDRYAAATGIAPDLWIAEPSAAAAEVTSAR